MEFLKETFGTEALTYEQFLEKINGNKKIKLANLADGQYISKEKYGSLETELSTVKGQLDAANNKIAGFESMDVETIKKEAADWKSQYETETSALKQKLEDQKYEFAAKRYADGLKFTSESARRAFVTDLMNKKLQMQDDAILGADDFKAKYAEADPGAFVTDQQQNAPRFSGTTRAQSSPQNATEIDAYFTKKYGDNPYYKK